MRITIVTGPWFPTPPGKAGAVERIWGDLAVRFARRGHSVTVLSRGEDGLDSEDVRDGVRTIRRTQFRQGRFIYWDLVKDMAYSLRMLVLLPPADVCVTNVFWLPALARLRGKGIGSLYVSIARVPKGHLFLYTHAPRIHAVSSFIYDAVVAQRPDLAHRTRAVPNPIDLAYFSPPKVARNFAPPSAQGRTLLYTGRIHPEKGLHVLAQAYARARERCPDLRLRLVGPSSVDKGGGGDAYVAQIRSLVGAHPVSIDAPIYERAKLADALREATFYCYPSLAEAGESFGVAPLEAGATGLAAIVSDLPAFREFLVDGENGLVFNHRASDPVAELERQIVRLATDPALAQRLGARAVEVARRYDYEQIAGEFLEDFARVVDGGGR